MCGLATLCLLGNVSLDRSTSDSDVAIVVGLLFVARASALAFNQSLWLLSCEVSRDTVAVIHMSRLA